MDGVCLSWGDGLSSSQWIESVLPGDDFCPGWTAFVLAGVMTDVLPGVPAVQANEQQARTQAAMCACMHKRERQRPCEIGLSLHARLSLRCMGAITAAVATSGVATV